MGIRKPIYDQPVKLNRVVTIHLGFHGIAGLKNHIIHTQQDNDTGPVYERELNPCRVAPKYEGLTVSYINKVYNICPRALNALRPSQMSTEWFHVAS